DCASLGHEEVASLLTKQRHDVFAAPGLIEGGDEFIQRQLYRRSSPGMIARPKDGSQTTRLSALGSTESSNQHVDLIIGNLCRRPIHSGLPVKGVAQSGGG